MIVKEKEVNELVQFLMIKDNNKDETIGIFNKIDICSFKVKIKMTL